MIEVFQCSLPGVEQAGYTMLHCTTSVMLLGAQVGVLL